MSILNEHVKIAGITSPDLLAEELSGGQAQAVAIARAVHFQRDILLLDEPTSALSVRETNKVLAIMRDIAEGGRSCVFVTHNLYHAYQVCDRFVVVSHGTVVKSVRKEETSLDELTALIMTH
jgi:simple sugar transport system ATP-binding protein